MPHNARTAAEPRLSRAAAFALTALLYAAGGIAALTLAIPPGYASPLFPAAGIALASVLVFGRRVLPAILLGSLAVNLGLFLPREPFTPMTLAVPLAIALGATLQALAGAWLVRHNLQRPLTLSEPRDVLAFLLVGMVSGLVSTLIANGALWASGAVLASELPANIATWWIGDLLGVLIAAPIMLTLFGRPRDAWAPRRVSVGLTMALVTVMLALGIRQIVAWNHERVQTVFNHDAANAVQALQAQLREPLQALEALRGVFVASDDVTAAEMRVATQAWLAPGRLQAMTWNVWMRRDEVAGFQQRVRSEDGRDR
ncbi:MAG TPA: MASE1 domain-containing protein, partial [Burkholderiaceae bacterium]